MKSKFLLIISFLYLNTNCLFAQTGPYVQLKFEANQEQLHKILSSGIDAEGISKQGIYYFGEFSQEEAQIVKRICKQAEVSIADMSLYYTNRASKDLATMQKQNAVAPPGFSLGSMNGFLTYVEIGKMLDSMQHRFPNLITVKKSIGSTLDNHEIYMVKISDHPNKQEPQEKQVLYDAMHHAREPQAMMQLMYYMWYIMNKYEQNDPIAKYILNNRELYFIPIVNPDGYVYNQSIAPNGSGMWRKNRSVNANSTRGVDLNRNYGYDWGYDDVGSSPSGNSNTFRGPSAFSELETQHMRDFVNTKKFKSNLSYHTYGGYLIFPFGAKLDYYTPDSILFRQYADSLTKDNGYSSGTVFETLSYFANGGSCDWMYGDSTHQKIYSFTPEVGLADDGFWPLPSRIIPLCEENIAPNLFLAKYAVNGLDVLLNDTTYVTDTSVLINVKYFSAGLENSKSIKSYIEFDNNTIVVSNTDTLTSNGLSTFSETSINFSVELNNISIQNRIPYRVLSIIDGVAQYDSAILIFNNNLGFTTKRSEINPLKIFPNPSSNYINIDFEMSATGKINIYTIDGKLMMSSNRKNIDVSKLKPAMYIVCVFDSNNVVAMERFYKE